MTSPARPAGAKNLVLTHLGPPTSPDSRGRLAQKTYPGKLVVGRDLMVLKRRQTPLNVRPRSSHGRHPYFQNEDPMRAALLSDRGATPTVQDFREPEPAPAQGAVMIDVTTAGLGGWDVLGAYRLPVDYPCVIRGEGVGRTREGRRVYFGERSVPPTNRPATTPPAPDSS